MAGGAGADAVFFVIVMLFLGLVSRSLLACSGIPYTLLMLLWGLLLGYGNMTYADNWRFFSPGTAAWQAIEPQVLAATVLPPLLFAGAHGLPPRALVKCAPHIALLGCLGVLTGIGMTGVLVRYVLPQGWTWTQCFLFGAIVAATDPVAAVALLREVDAPLSIRVTVDGEALVDDGVAAVMYAVFLVFVEGRSASAGDVVRIFARQSLGGPAVGVAFAACAVAWFRFSPPNAVTEASVLLLAAYGSFFVAEDIFAASGILATVFCGFAVCLLDARFGRREARALAPESAELVWAALDFLFNTLAFVLCGVIIAARVYLAFNSGSVRGRDVGWAVLLWLLLLAVRVVNFTAFWPVLRRTGYGFSLAEAAIGCWAGLRGIVGLVLALTVLSSDSAGSAAFRDQQFFYMAAVLVLTVLLQGGTFPFLLRGLSSRVAAAEEVARLRVARAGSVSAA